MPEGYLIWIKSDHPRWHASFSRNNSVTVHVRAGENVHTIRYFVRNNRFFYFDKAQGDLDPATLEMVDSSRFLMVFRGDPDQLRLIWKAHFPGEVNCQAFVHFGGCESDQFLLNVDDLRKQQKKLIDDKVICLEQSFDVPFAPYSYEAPRADYERTIICKMPGESPPVTVWDIFPKLETVGDLEEALSLLGSAWDDFLVFKGKVLGEEPARQNPQAVPEKPAGSQEMPSFPDLVPSLRHMLINVRDQIETNANDLEASPQLFEEIRSDLMEGYQGPPDPAIDKAAQETILDKLVATEAHITHVRDRCLEDEKQIETLTTVYHRLGFLRELLVEHQQSPEQFSVMLHRCGDELKKAIECLPKGQRS
jgi:hypothetical protein